MPRFKAPVIYKTVLTGDPKRARVKKANNCKPNEFVLCESEVRETCTDCAFLHNKKLNKIRNRMKRRMKKLHFQAQTTAPAFKAWILKEVERQEALWQRVLNGEIVEISK